MKKLHIFQLIILAFFVVWGVSLARCEVLTLLHGREFAEGYKENTMLGDMEYWKVMDCSANHAKVYYISAHYTGGNVVTFTRKDSDAAWVYDGWDTIWSTEGNADKTLWPYLWHFAYSHPRWKD